jgi:HK97 family phage major capsid protein
MPFEVAINGESDIAGLTYANVIKALDERNQVLHTIFEEAGDELDASKVAAIEVKDGKDLATQIKARNDELSKLGERREHLETIMGIRDTVQEERKHLDGHPVEPGAFAPRAGAVGDQRREPVKNLGQLVTEEETFKDWMKRGAPKGTGLDYQFDDLLPSRLLAQALNFRTIGNTLFETTAGWAPESVRLPGFVEAVTRPIQLIDILPMASTGQEKVVYMEETTRTHAAAEKAEGVAFAESTFALTERESSVRKITDSMPVTDEQLEDVPQVESYLNGRLLYGLRQRLDSQVLIGNGTAPNLRGIKNVSGIQTQAKGADPTPDAFFKAMTKIRVTGRAMPTHILIHPTNWESVRLLRTTDGIYIWGSPSEAGPERMWGLPIIQQDADTAGTGYVGSFLPPWISLFERRGVDIQVGYVGDQFKEGKRTIRGDMRFAFVVFRPAAFATVTGL